MSHVLTVKIPHSLLNQLEEESQREGKSKGAVVREAVQHFLRRRPRKEDPNEIFRKATEAMLKGKKFRPPHKIDWEAIRKKAAATAPDMAPEEEVMAFRRRHF